MTPPWPTSTSYCSAQKDLRQCLWEGTWWDVKNGHPSWPHPHAGEETIRNSLAMEQKKVYLMHWSFHAKRTGTASHLNRWSQDRKKVLQAAFRLYGEGRFLNAEGWVLSALSTQKTKPIPTYRDRSKEVLCGWSTEYVIEDEAREEMRCPMWRGRRKQAKKEARRWVRKLW